MSPSTSRRPPTGKFRPTPAPVASPSRRAPSVARPARGPTSAASLCLCTCRLALPLKGSRTRQSRLPLRGVPLGASPLSPWVITRRLASLSRRPSPASTLASLHLSTRPTSGISAGTPNFSARLFTFAHSFAYSPVRRSSKRLAYPSDAPCADSDTFTKSSSSRTTRSSGQGNMHRRRTRRSPAPRPSALLPTPAYPHASVPLRSASYSASSSVATHPSPTTAPTPALNRPPRSTTQYRTKACGTHTRDGRTHSTAPPSGVWRRRTVWRLRAAPRCATYVLPGAWRGSGERATATHSPARASRVTTQPPLRDTSAPVERRPSTPRAALKLWESCHPPVSRSIGGRTSTSSASCWMAGTSSAIAVARPLSVLYCGRSEVAREKVAEKTARMTLGPERRPRQAERAVSTAGGWEVEGVVRILHV
mmetsp:Transcript_7844/g.16364  ORF Transcript_7844/g.16364 Transcript_7844/m.16364 type:complete len:422 (-) Transcript_7844:104-1369(-)